MDFVSFSSLILLHHQVAIEVINIQMQLYRLEFVVIWVIVALARLVLKEMFSPALA